MRIGEVGGEGMVNAMKDVEQKTESEAVENGGGASGAQASVQVSLLRNAQEFSAKLMDQLLG